MLSKYAKITVKPLFLDTPTLVMLGYPDPTPKSGKFPEFMASRSRGHFQTRLPFPGFFFSRTSLPSP